MFTTKFTKGKGKKAAPLVAKFAEGGLAEPQREHVGVMDKLLGSKYDRGVRQLKQYEQTGMYSPKYQRQRQGWDAKGISREVRKDLSEEE